MGIFGWDLPPGCSSVPGDEEGSPTCITDLVLATGTKLPKDVVDVWFDGEYIYETVVYTVAADTYNNTPEYTNTDSVVVCSFDLWDDNESIEAENKRAAEHYAHLIREKDQPHG